MYLWDFFFLLFISSFSSRTQKLKSEIALPGNHLQKESAASPAASVSMRVVKIPPYRVGKLFDQQIGSEKWTDKP